MKERLGNWKNFDIGSLTLGVGVIFLEKPNEGPKTYLPYQKNKPKVNKHPQRDCRINAIKGIE